MADTFRDLARLGGPAGYGSYAVTKRIGKLNRSILLRGMRVLDLGCGNGCYTTELLHHARWVCGLDIQYSNLQDVVAKIPLVQGAAESLPFDSGCFDAVTLIEVLEHTVCDSKVLAECFRILRPGGLLILFVPNKLYPFESHPCFVGSVRIGRNIPLVSWLPGFLHRRISTARIYTKRRIVAMACAAGFGVNRISYIFPPLDNFPLPFKSLYRRLACRLEETPLRIFGVSLFLVFEKLLK